jgi:hypothetical protein
MFTRSGFDEPIIVAGNLKQRDDDTYQLQGLDRFMTDKVSPEVDDTMIQFGRLITEGD